MSRSRAIRLLIPLLCGLLTAPSFAEGPLNVSGPSDTVAGVPFRWNPAKFPLTYWTDLGTLGSRTNDQSNAIAANAFDTWAGVNTSTITFSRSGSLGGDVTSVNYQIVEDAINACTNLGSNPAGGVARERSIIYDTNGSIIDLVYGPGQSDFTLGFATPTCLTNDTFYNRGYAVMNGKNNPTDLELHAVMVHEFGHMLGLDHSQINVECLTSCSADALAGLPTMFPVLVDDAEMSTPATDDIAGLSVLYPSATFSTSTGKITGRIYFSDDMTQAQNFNVIARLVGDPSTTAVSSISGFRFTGDNGNSILLYPGSPSLNGSRDQTLIGEYVIPGLLPGNYTVEVEAIDPSFTLGSGMGPVGYVGIVFPMPSTVCPTGEFYDSSESNHDICTDSTPVPVNAGLESPGVDIILNGTPPRYDAWENGP